jgi:hypothetical protein
MAHCSACLEELTDFAVVMIDDAQRHSIGKRSRSRHGAAFNSRPLTMKQQGAGAIARFYQVDTALERTIWC